MARAEQVRELERHIGSLTLTLEVIAELSSMWSAPFADESDDDDDQAFQRLDLLRRLAESQVPSRNGSEV